MLPNYCQHSLVSKMLPFLETGLRCLSIECTTMFELMYSLSNHDIRECENFKFFLIHSTCLYSQVFQNAFVRWNLNSLEKKVPVCSKNSNSLEYSLDVFAFASC